MSTAKFSESELGGNCDFLGDAKIQALIDNTKAPDSIRFNDLLQKSRALSGLTPGESLELLLAGLENPEFNSAIKQTARYVKDFVYGARLVLFAPLYISNICGNNCLYCAFRSENKQVKRKALSQTEIADEVLALIRQGHKRLLLVAGESAPDNPVTGLDYIIESIQTAYNTREGSDEIRRVNVNLAPLSIDQFKRLRQANIGTYQIFQETFHQEIYRQVHVSGLKKHYAWRTLAIDRAMQAGIEDCGVGVLFGLAPYKFDFTAMLIYIQHLEQRFGVGPHTISVPRLEPADGSDLASNPVYPVTDEEFLLMIAIYRLAVPYTGIILSTRENSDIRRESLALGVSQISAGSRTDPGGYATADNNTSQFTLGDHRSLAEIIEDVTKLGYIPSFCTGCYRLGRVGQEFMDLARPGDIHNHCAPNALATFMEYLLDHASPDLQKIGKNRINQALDDMPATDQKYARQLVERVGAGERDVYC